MPDLEALTSFATARRHNLTGPLAHQQVLELAEAWIPEVRFHQRERHHPVDLADLVEIPNAVFAGLSEAEKEEFRISVKLDAFPLPVIEAFDPPVVHVPNGAVRRVLASGADTEDAFDDLDLGQNGVFTYGPNRKSARKFFGSNEVASGAATPSAGDPRLPRHLPMVVRAELRMLLEALKHELELDDLPAALASRGRPIDAIWSGFSVEHSFFRSERQGQGATTFSRALKREILAELIAAHEAEDEDAEAAALARIPSGHHLIDKAWEVVKRFAFLEYYLVYPFNDYKEYGTWPFENEHEGDVEGCCLVFERRFLEQFAAGTRQLASVVPHSVITSAHEEFHGIDSLKRLSVLPDRARDDLVVFVAAGSHATYLTPGDHDILDFGDVLFDLPLQLPTWIIVLGVLTGILPVLALIAAITEHFVDSEDLTSDDGASIGPGPADPANLRFDRRVEVTPLSDIGSDLNIYQPAQRAALALRGFVGKWGADDGSVDKSPAWKNKTDRYFRRFLRGDVEPTVIVD